MRYDEEVWNKLVKKLSPVSVTNNIDKIGIDITGGGITAVTIKPDSFSMQDTQEESNGKVFVYEDFGINVKNRILERLSDAIIDTPALSNYQLKHCTMTKEEIHPVYELSYRATEKWIKQRLAEALSSEGRIKQPSNLAYGRIDTVYYSPKDPFEGWTFDGTLYRYTKEPFDYWTETTSMEDWVDFASDSERYKDVVRDRDRYVIHFHPWESTLSDNHPYIEWYKSVEEYAQDQYELDGDVVEESHLVEIEIDDVGSTIYNNIVL